MIAPRSRFLLFQLLQYVGPTLLILLAYDIIVVVAYHMGYLQWAGLEQIPLSLFGSVIGVILAFRNSSSYARWWEARTLWGAIVNNSRGWARLVVTTVGPLQGGGEDLRTAHQKLVYLQIAWVHALRQHLRKLDPLPAVAHVLAADEVAALKGQSNVPTSIQVRQSALLRSCLDRGWIDKAQWHAMNQSLDDLIDAQGGCERIKNTPMPRQYDYVPHLCAHLFCLLLPLTMVSNLGWFTPLGSAFVGFIFLTLDKIGRDLEDPFDNTIHDIPLTSMCTTIEINLRQMLGETQLPAPTTPVHGVLW